MTLTLSRSFFDLAWSKGQLRGMEHGDVEDGRARYEGEKKIQEMGRRFGKKKKKKYSIIARERVESGGWLKVWKGVVAH